MIAACPFPFPRGTPIRIYRMAEALSQRGHEVHVVTYHLGEGVKNIPFKIHRIPDIKTYKNFAPGPTYQKLFLLDPLLTVKLFRVLKKYKIDLIHAHHYEGLLISSFVRKWTRHPLIYDAHTLMAPELPFYGLGLTNKLKRNIGLYFDRHVPQLADHVITVTEELRDKIIKNTGIAPENVTASINGVEIKHFDVKKQNKIVPEESVKKLIFTGNLASYQGIDLLLSSFSEVIKCRKGVRLQLVSDSPFDDYVALARRLKVTEFIDIIPSDIDRLPEYLADADIALNPRVKCDGIPQKLLNYMAAGKPIVTFKGSAKIIEHEKTGWIVDDEDISGFANAILSLLNNSEYAQKIGSNAKKYVKQNNSWEKTAEKVEKVYGVLSNRLTDFS